MMRYTLRELHKAFGLLHDYMQFYATNYTYIDTLTWWLSTFSLYMVVILTTERYYSICKRIPLAVPRTLVAIVSLALGSFVYHCPQFFVDEPAYPPLTMLAFLIGAIRKAMDTTSRDRTKDSENKMVARELTKGIVGIAIVSIITRIPTFVFYAYDDVRYNPEVEPYLHIRPEIVVVIIKSILLFSLTSCSCKFYILLLASTRFKKHFSKGSAHDPYMVEKCISARPGTALNQICMGQT
jgi:hypothetical protein